MSLDWNTKYNYNFPTPIRFGKGVVAEAGPHLVELGLKSALVVSDAGMLKLPMFEETIAGFKKAGLKVTVFSEIAKNPVKANVLAGADSYKKGQCDCIIGFGGGASMDVARAIALRVNHTDRDLFDFDDALDGWKHVTRDIPYFITIPTTCGTGSEVGRSTVIADDVTHEKKILFSPKLLAKKVFADPELTMKVPAFITATTGMDALTHNVEAYVAKGFSPLCEGIALEGVRLVAQSLERAVNNPDLESRSKMMMASLMGAVAFQKGLGIVHSFAHPLSTVVDMHHGLANAIMIPFGMEFNAPVCADKFKNMAQACGLKDTSAESFIQYLRDLNRKIGVPANLGSQKVTKEHLNKLADLAIKDPCHGSNPKAVTRDDFYRYYEKAL